MIILLHSSKTMRAPSSKQKYRAPMLLNKAVELDAYLKTLSATKLAKAMKISGSLAQKTHELITAWQPNKDQSLALDCFIGDIYSGLQVGKFSDSDRDYADKVLYILSGLYGVLRPYDGIRPYRCEMGYKFSKKKFANLYNFWGKSIADCLPSDELIVDLSAIEYSKTVTPFIDPSRFVTPRFLTVNEKTKEPTFVVVHSKIARGAFARWLIQSRKTDRDDLLKFTDLGYAYDASLSTRSQPTFVCREFGGIGLSVRLT